MTEDRALPQCVHWWFFERGGNMRAMLALVVMLCGTAIAQSSSLQPANVFPWKKSDYQQQSVILRW